MRIEEEGVKFRSHLDGSRHFLSPERSIEIQEALGADVIMAFDECPPALAERRYHEASLARTQRWLVRCKAAWEGAERLKAEDGPGLADAPGPGARRVPPPPLGALRHRPGRALRATSASGPSRRRPRSTCPGYALGGYAVGEEPAQMWEGVARDAPRLPGRRPAT